MPVLNVERPAFMQDEEVVLFENAVIRFFEDHAPESRTAKWRRDGIVEREQRRRALDRARTERRAQAFFEPLRGFRSQPSPAGTRSYRPGLPGRGLQQDVMRPFLHGGAYAADDAGERLRAFGISDHHVARRQGARFAIEAGERFPVVRSPSDQTASS